MKINSVIRTEYSKIQVERSWRQSSVPPHDTYRSTRGSSQACRTFIKADPA